MTLRISAVSLAALLATCSHPTSAAAPASPVASAACRVTDVLSVDSTWREVRGAGFTFCIPGTWQPRGRAERGADAKMWKGAIGGVVWDEGKPPTLIDPHQTFEVTGRVVVVQRGQVPPGTQDVVPLPPDPNEQTCKPPVNQTFQTGAVSMVLTQVDCQGIWTVTGWSVAPAMYVQGVAHGPAADATLVSMVATIRFAAPVRRP